MKRVTASEARKNWFQLLDEVAAGEVVVIDRKRKRLVLRREKIARNAVPDYSNLLQVRDPDEADAWHWEWQGPGRKLRPRTQKR